MHFSILINSFHLFSELLLVYFLFALISLTMFAISMRINNVAGITINKMKPTGVLTKKPRYPKYGITAITLPMTFSFLTIHSSGSSVASPFVINPSFVTLIILWVTLVAEPEVLKHMMSPMVKSSGSTGFITTMLPTGMAGSMLPVKTGS